MAPLPVTWNRGVRFIAVEDDAVHVGEPVDEALDVGIATFEGKEVKVNELSGTSLLDLSAKLTGKVLTVKTVLSPIAEEETYAIRCIGLNYQKHAREASLPFPEVPIMFLKPETSLSGPYPDPIVIHKNWQDDQADFESELTLVIGKTCRNVSEAEALDYVLGYASSNDVSARKHQGAPDKIGTTQWCYGKGFDKMAPVGPVLASSKLIPDPTILKLRGIKNGKVVQETPLSDLIFSCAKLVSFLSTNTTLKPGTIVMTGTPQGVGWFSKDLLKDGDDFRVEVLPHCGTLINIVKFE